MSKDQAVVLCQDTEVEREYVGSRKYRLGSIANIMLVSHCELKSIFEWHVSQALFICMNFCFPVISPNPN